MYFQPAVPFGGYAGWRVLENSAPHQRETFEKSPGLVRDIEYFRDNIEKATTADALVKDRRLLTVALGAFGLKDEVDKKAFIQRILEGGVEDQQSFANRLNEPRFRKLAKAFGYGDLTGGTNIQLSSFKEDIIARYKSLEFERAVGEVDGDMRLAMNFRREIAALAESDSVERTGWLQVMGQLPLRKFMTTALGLPESIAQLDLDQQKEIFERKADALFGDKSLAIFTDPANIDEAIRRFFLFRQMQNGPNASTPGAAALTLLQGPAISGGGIENLLLSQVQF